MKKTVLMMGMPITVEIVDPEGTGELTDKVFDYFDYIDHKFSVFKTDSEITQINRGELKTKDYSRDMKTVWKLAKNVKKTTDGYFDVEYRGKYDLSGIVKGWAILKAANILAKAGIKNYYVEAGGDIQTKGYNAQKLKWRIGIRHPFEWQKIVKVVAISNLGIATSGTYFRGQHVYNPKKPGEPITEVVSMTVIGPDICQADGLATAALAMGKNGINFIEKQKKFEGYMIDHRGWATATSGFKNFVVENGQVGG